MARPASPLASSGDDRGQAARRLRLPLASTEAECEGALANRWVCVNPHRMFPGQKLKDGFNWCCHWAFQASKRGPGRKILYVDEIWQWMDQHNIPEHLENCARTGRIHGLELIATTHSPGDFHKDLRRLVTEWVVFNMVEPSDLDYIAPYFPGVYKAATLPRFHFIAYNRNSGVELAGQL